MKTSKAKILGTIVSLTLIVSPAASTQANLSKSFKSYGDNTVAKSAYYKIGSPYKIKGKKYFPKLNHAYKKEGVASWYGPGFHGKLTANGDLYDLHEFTAAHKTLPMFSVVKVTNLENGRTIKVVINDRGPFAHDRIIDMSEAAAKSLDFKKQGTAKVKVEYSKEHTEAYLKRIGMFEQYKALASN